MQPVECLEEGFGRVETGGPKKQKSVNAGASGGSS